MGPGPGACVLCQIPGCDSWTAQSREVVAIAALVAALVLIITCGFVFKFTESGVDSFGYWLVVTLSTVGYGDEAPTSGWARFFTSLLLIDLMLGGYSGLHVLWRRRCDSKYSSY